MGDLNLGVALPLPLKGSVGSHFSHSWAVIAPRFPRHDPILAHPSVNTCSCTGGLQACLVAPPFLAGADEQGQGAAAESHQKPGELRVLRVFRSTDDPQTPHGVCGST